MKTNVGPFDGWLRIAVFLALMVNAIFAGTLISLLLVIPGAIFFATAVLTWCPVYEIFSINTARQNPSGHNQ